MPHSVRKIETFFNKPVTEETVDAIFHTHTKKRKKKWNQKLNFKLYLSN